MALKFCANLSFMFQETTSLLERYTLARDAGFKGVECAFPYEYTPESIVKAKMAAGVEQVLINAYPGDWSKGDRGLAAIPGREVEFMSGIERAVDYAKKLDCKRIHIMAGIVTDETSEHMKVFKNNLRLAARVLGENGITGLIEPINKYSMKDYYLNDYQKAKAIISEINSPHLKLQLDLFHMQHITGNLTKNIQELLPITGHIQIAQVPDRHEPDMLGEINYHYVFSLLRKLGYNDWIGLEYTPAAGTKDGLAWMSKMNS